METCHGAIWHIEKSRGKSDLPWQTCHVAMVASWQISSKFLWQTCCHSDLPWKISWQVSKWQHIGDSSKQQSKYLAFSDIFMATRNSKYVATEFAMKTKKANILPFSFHNFIVFKNKFFLSIIIFVVCNNCCFQQSHPRKRILFVIEKNICYLQFNLYM